MRHIKRVRALVGVVGVALASTLVVAPVAAGSPQPSVGSGSWPGGAVVIVQLHAANGAPVTNDDLLATIGVVQARLAALDASEAIVSGIAEDRLRIDIADAAARDDIVRVATAPGMLDFVGVPNQYANSIVTGQPMPAGMDQTPIFSGDQISAARLGADPSGLPAVDIDLKEKGATIFDDYAKDHYQERFAIVLDGKVLEAPSINATNFNGHAQISGGFDDQSARELVAMLTGGVLPVAAEVVQECPASGACPGSSASPSVPPGG